MWEALRPITCAWSKCHELSVHCGVKSSVPATVRSAWATAWREPSFRSGWLAVLLTTVPIVFFLPVFFAHIEAKPGLVPYDPVLALVGPWDVTWLTFTVLYGTVLVGVWRGFRDPWCILRGSQAYLLMLVLRGFAMEAFTLEAPADIIPLIDPVTALVYPGDRPFQKDLFFSGHTATLAIMFCIAIGRKARSISLLATVSIAVLVLVQHVHWTVDVLAAPVFVWLAWRGSALTLRLCERPSA
jgi:PAP2 superfamily C-terminal